MYFWNLIGRYVVLSYRLPQIHSTPEHRCETRRAVEGEETNEPKYDEDWYRR